VGGRQPQDSAAGHENPIARRAAHRFVAGERLDESLDVAAALNSRRIGGILDLLAEGVTDLSGASHAVAEYVPSTDYRYPHIAG
jgi:hypothetical protein